MTITKEQAQVKAAKAKARRDARKRLEATLTAIEAASVELRATADALPEMGMASRAILRSEALELYGSALSIREALKGR